MRTMKFLFCAACLCSAGVFARTAMTQETTVDPDGLPVDSGSPIDEPVKPPTEVERDSFEAPQDERAFIDDPATRKPGLDEPERPRKQFQNLNDRDRATQFREGDIPMRPRSITRTVTERILEPIPIKERQAMQKLQAAIQSLKTGKDEAVRKAAADTILQQLTAQFETDLKQREKELAEVEQRVKTLREQLDKRKTAQADIINLRLQTLVNDANGLGFPDTNFGTNAQSDPKQFFDDSDYKRLEPGDPLHVLPDPKQFYIPSDLDRKVQ